jgi:1-acyl-sn-glycerol-3-phosphate acyltransferase
MIRTATFWVVVVPSTAFFSLVSILGGLARAPRGLHDWVHRNWAGSLLWAAGVRVEVVGAENVLRDAPQVFIANHQSIFDVFAMLAHLPASVRFIAKQELGRIPVLAQAMRAAGHVFIDRQNRRESRLTMRTAGERMKRENLSLGLFPEGTRSRDGRLGNFKKGAFQLAIETQVPIVPICVDGSHKIVVGRRVRPGRMSLCVARALPTQGRDAEDRDVVLEAVRQTIASGLTG